MLSLSTTSSLRGGVLAVRRGWYLFWADTWGTGYLFGRGSVAHQNCFLLPGPGYVKWSSPVVLCSPRVFLVAPSATSKPIVCWVSFTPNPFSVMMGRRII